MKTYTSIRALLAWVSMLTIGLPALVQAEDEKPTLFGGSLSGNVTLASDYSFRGYTQTERGFALQGGIDWEHPSGFFIGAWGSNLRWAGNVEIDVYGGYAGEVGAISYDVGATYFGYPAEDDCDCQWDYWEFFLNTGFEIGSLDWSLGILFSPEYWGEDGFGAGGTWYLSGGVGFPSWSVGSVELALDAGAGYTHGSEDDFFAVGESGYIGWNVGLNVGMPGNLSLDLRYWGSDLDGEDVLGAGWTPDQAEGLDDGLFVLAIGYAF